MTKVNININADMKIKSLLNQLALKADESADNWAAFQEAGTQLQAATEELAKLRERLDELELREMENAAANTEQAVAKPEEVESTKVGKKPASVS